MPASESEADERAFWENRDSTDHVNWAAAERARFPNLKPSTRAISLRLPVALLERIKITADEAHSTNCRQCPKRVRKEAGDDSNGDAPELSTESVILLHHG